MRLLSLLLIIFAQIFAAQNSLDAYVKIIDNDKAGDVAIYRFTVQIEAGSFIQTFLPLEVNVTTSLNICRLYSSINNSTQAIQSCVIDPTQNMVQFSIQSTFTGYLVYDLGQFRNPAYSTLLSNFTVQTLDSQKQIVAVSDPFSVYVQINPNIITSQSLQVGSPQIAVQTTYLFQMTVTNAVPMGGFIQLTFPSTQIPVPDTPPTSMISINNGASWINAPVTITTSTAMTLRVDLLIPTSSQFQLKILQLNNPNTMAVTQSFSVKTLTPSQRVIDQVSSGLTVYCTQPAVISIDSVTQSTKRVGAITSITFKTTLPTKYSSGGYLLVKLPTTLSVDTSNFQCILLIGFNDDQGLCKMPNANSVMLYDIINQPSLVFSIQGIVNPPNTKPTENFQVQAFDPYGNLIAFSNNFTNFGFTPTPGTIIAPVSLRSVNIVGQSSNATISFQIQNILQTNQLLQITVPTNQFQAPSSPTVCSIQTVYESAAQSVSCTMTVSSTSFTLLMAVNCGGNTITKQCEKNTKFIVSLSGLTNTNWINSVITDSVMIQTMTSDKLFLVDMIKTGIYTQPQLVEGTFSNTSLTKTIGFVGDVTQIQFRITLQNMIASTGYLTVQFQDQTFGEPALLTISTASNQTSLPNSFTKYSSGYLSSITMYSLCGAGTDCAAGQTLTINVINLLNPNSVKPIVNSFTFRSFTQTNSAIDKLTFTQAQGLTILPASFNSINLRQPVQTSQITTGALQTYILAIVPKNGIQATYGSLIVELPEKVQFYSNTSCTAVQEAQLESLVCKVFGNSFIISNVNAANNYKNQTIVVSGINIGNPQITGVTVTGNVTSYLKDQSQIQYFVDQTLNAFSITSNQPNQLISVMVTRSATTVNLVTQLTVCWTPFNPVPAGSIITINVPTDQAIFGKSVISDLNVILIQGQQIQLETKIYTFQQQCFNLSGAITNPSTPKPPNDSIQMMVQTSSGNQIDQLNSNIFITPYLSAGPFSAIKIQSQGQVVGKSTTLVIQVTIAATLQPNSRIYVIIPTSTFYIMPSDKIQCQILSEQIQNCQSVQTQSDTIGEFLQTFIAPTFKVWQAGEVLTLTVSNLRNKFNSRSTAALITVQSQDSSGFTINSSEFILSLAFTPNTDGLFSVQRSALVVQKATVLQLSVNLQTRLAQGSKMTINLPSFYLTSPWNIKVQLNKQDVGFTSSNTQSFYLITFNMPASSDKSDTFISISGFKNRYSLDFSNDAISLQTLSKEGYQVDVFNSTAFSDLLIVGSVSVSGVSIDRNTVGSNTILAVGLKTDGFVKAGDSIMLKNQKNSFMQFSSIKVLIDETPVTLIELPNENNFWRGFILTLNKDITNSIALKISGLQNLNRVEPLDFEFEIEVKSSQGGQIFVGHTDINDLSLLQPTQLQSVTLLRSSNIVTTKTALQISFQNTDVDILPYSTLRILVPKSALIIQDNCETSQELLCTIYEYNTTFIVINLNKVCPFGCSAGSQVLIPILKGLKNPATAQYTSISAQMDLSNQGFLVATQSNGINVEPDLQSADINILQLAVTQSNNIAGATTAVSIQFQIDSSTVPVAQIVINIPDKSFIITDSVLLTCSVGVQTGFGCSVKQKSQQITGLSTFVLQVVISGLTNQITTNKNLVVVLNNLRNTDLPSSRLNPQNLTLTLISNSNIILASSQTPIQANLSIPIMQTPTFVRSQTQPGLPQVIYYLTFITPNYIRQDHYIQLTIPYEQAVVNRLTCTDQVSGRGISCQLKKSDSIYQFVEIASWCKQITQQGFCEPGQQLKLRMTFQNPSIIQNQGLVNDLTVFTESDEKVSASAGFLTTPSLDSLSVFDVSFKRSVNILGAQNETFSLIIGRLGASVLVDTDLAISLPDGLLFPSKLQQANCFRVFDGDKQLPCTITQTYNTSGSISQILVPKFCNQNYICITQLSIELKIVTVANPSTNRILTSQSLSLSFRQQSREIGFITLVAVLAPMLPGYGFIETKVASSCTTLQTCAINFTLTLTNQMKAGDYAILNTPIDLLSQVCNVQSGQPFTCTILNTRSLKITVSSNITLIQFQVSSALMPTSSQLLAGFNATTYEVISSKQIPIEILQGGSISVLPSTFQNFNVRRQSSLLNQITDLNINITTRHKARGDSLQIYVPLTLAILSSNGVTCQFLNQLIPCIIAQQTVTFTQFGQVCSSPDQGCSFLIKNVKNPNSVIYDQSQNQVQALLQVFSQGSLFDVHKSQSAITPMLFLQDLTLTGLAFSPILMTAGQSISFNYQFQVQQNDGNYMIVQFQQDFFTPFITQVNDVTVQCGETLTNIIDIQSYPSASDQVPLKSISFTLPRLTTMKNYQVTIRGIQAPNFWTTKLNFSLITVLYVKSAVNQIAQKSNNVTVDFSPSTLDPITAYSDNPFISQLTNITFSFTIQPLVMQGQISLTLPQGFVIQNKIRCFDLYTETNIACNISNSTNTISIAINNTQTRPYSGFSIKVGPIKNINQISDRIFQVRVQDGAKMYAVGSFSIFTSTPRADCSEGCELCTPSGECARCTTGLVLNGKNCTVICDQNEFEFNGRCYKCSQSCLQCQRQDSCSVCAADKIFMSGMCIESCPPGFTYNSNSDFQSCQYNSNDGRVDCQSQSRQNFLQGANLSTGTNSSNQYCTPSLTPECSVAGCYQCGLFSNYCDNCLLPLRNFDGNCIKSCLLGYFLYNNQCYKCSPACQECEGNANICTSCKGKLFFAEGYNTCVRECPTGTLLKSGRCIQCDDKCNSCINSVSQCTSCFKHFQNGEDLYFSDGDCLQTCPFGTSTDYKTHQCVKTAVGQSVLIWSLPLAAFALILVLLVTRLSRCFGKRIDRPYWVASALLNLIDFLNRVILLCLLWPSTQIAQFCITGLSILGASLIGIYETQTVIVKQRPRLHSFLSAMSGPYSTRLMLGNAFGKYAHITNNRHLKFQMSSFERCCFLQTVLVLLQTANSIAVFMRFGLNEATFGIGVNGLIFGSVQLFLQVLIRCTRNKEGTTIPKEYLD